MKSVSGGNDTDTPAGGGATVAGEGDSWLRTAGARLRVPPAGWRARSACASVGHDLFVGELTPEQETRAKAICERCQVQDDCLAFSITHGVRYGVWGGLNETERQHVREIWSAQRTLGVGSRARRTA
jgi:WhiB family transcriptional regulator, redox-sensing transcriptional regulator